MATMGRMARAVALLMEHEGKGSGRYIDMAVSFRVADVETLEDGTKRWKPGSDEELICVGGQWDRKRKRYVGRASRAVIIRVHRGQEAAARWLARWLRCRITGDWSGFKRLWSVLLIGGRRSGKSHIACIALVLYVVAFPRSNGKPSLVWTVSPTQETSDELEQALRSLLPREWYTFTGLGNGKASLFKLANHARLIMLSGHKPRGLKRGRVDLVLFNEAQNQHKKGYVQLRGAVADTGGLVLLAANPPDEPIGLWVDDFYQAAKAGELESEVFEFDPKANPWITYEALLSMAKEVDEDTFAREILGEMRPIGIQVFHAWSDRYSWIDPPASYVDITAEFTKKNLGRAFGYLVGMDFQLTPHMAATVAKVFIDPADPEREPLMWIVDEVVAENADEDELIDALEGTGRWTPAGKLSDVTYRGWFERPDENGQGGDDPANPVACAVVMDASAWFQDGEHSRGKHSNERLEARGWRYLWKPQVDSDKNPDLVDRYVVGNTRLKNAEGMIGGVAKRRLFVARHCKRTAEAMKKFENRNGAPHRRSVYAHITDCVTYLTYRFWGAPRVKRKGEYKGLHRRERRRQFDGVV
jgi:hypothetical protein